MHGGSLHKDEWLLVCSGALVNERTVVVAAHCVTDLGKVTMVKTADLKVVLGKFYRDDDRDEKTIQSLRVREGCNVDPGPLAQQTPSFRRAVMVSVLHLSTLAPSREPGM